MDREELLERLADLEHQQWIEWTKYMLDKLYPLFSPDALADESRLEDLNRWNKQIETSYEDLSEKEKESDRKFARKIMFLTERRLNDDEQRNNDTTSRV
jgi:hypothetical protein